MGYGLHLASWTPFHTDRSSERRWFGQPSCISANPGAGSAATPPFPTYNYCWQIAGIPVRARLQRGRSPSRLSVVATLTQPGDCGRRWHTGIPTNRSSIPPQLPVASTPPRPSACERRRQAGIPAIARRQCVCFPPPTLAVGATF